MPDRRASPRRTQQVGCLWLWPGERHKRLLGCCLLTEEKAGLGWTEHIALASRGCPLNSRDPERVRAPDHPNGPCRAPAWFDPSIGSDGRYRAPAWSDPSIGPTDYATERAACRRWPEPCPRQVSFAKPRRTIKAWCR